MGVTKFHWEKRSPRSEPYLLAWLFSIKNANSILCVALSNDCEPGRVPRSISWAGPDASRSRSPVSVYRLAIPFILYLSRVRFRLLHFSVRMFGVLAVEIFTRPSRSGSVCNARWAGAGGSCQYTLRCRRNSYVVVDGKTLRSRCAPSFVYSWGLQSSARSRCGGTQNV